MTTAARWESCLSPGLGKGVWDRRIQIGEKWNMREGQRHKGRIRGLVERYGKQRRLRGHK